MPSLDTPTLVAEIRDRLRLSQEELARRLDVSFATVNAWERGRTVPRRLHRLALDRLAAEIGIRQGVTVLVIDDDDDAVALAAGLISASGHDVETVTVTNGSDGLLLCGVLKPDLVLLDIRMPGIDGFAVADSLQRIPGLEHTILYFVTGHIDEHVRERVAATGARGVFEKPLTAEVVGASLDEAMTTERRIRGDDAADLEAQDAGGVQAEGAGA